MRLYNYMSQYIKTERENTYCKNLIDTIKFLPQHSARTYFEASKARASLYFYGRKSELFSHKNIPILSQSTSLAPLAVRVQVFQRHSLYMALIKRIFFNILLVTLGVLILLNSFPVFSFAASSDDLEVAGWIPYWRDSQGIKDAKKHLKSIDMIFPFAFTMQADGTIKDNADLDSSEWKKFTKLAQKEGKKVVPTIMTSDAGTVHANLSYPELRKKHIDNIFSKTKLCSTVMGHEL